MQKIQSYLYPNRVIILADLAGFTTENTVVYAKTIKIYKGVDNVIQFDVQNADQKRLNLVTSPPITNLQLNVMDASGKALANSPYTISSTSITGIGTATIPQADTANLAHQFLKYSVTALDSNEFTIPLYTDSKFSAVGTIELVGSATPVTRSSVVYDKFSGEINFMGNVINHTSAIPAKFYEATPTTTVNFAIHVTGFVGNLYLEATEDSTISVESFRNATQLQTFSSTSAVTQTVNFAGSVGNYNYFRVSWKYPDIWQFGSQQNALLTYGTVDTVTVSY
jgi:hypothetical protein